jgi:hypothetical protein
MQEAIMDSDRFDALARCLSEGTTRRRLTRLLGGLALGSLLRPPASAAEKGGNHKKSDKDKKGHKEKARSEKGKKGDDGKRDTGGHEKGKQNTDETKDIHGHKAKASGDGKQGTPEIAGTDTTATVTASATTSGCLSPGAPCSVNLKCCSGKCSKRICPPA